MNDNWSYADICKAGALLNTQSLNPTTSYCDYEVVRSTPRSNEEIPDWAKCCGWR